MKDQEIGWKQVRYIQSQINNHVWWLSKIVGYANNSDAARMLKNIQNHSLEVPEMALLVKDHKSWDPDSGTPVPSRPVVSGNRGVNTHLSELISEILEPITMQMGGGEIASTEEALYAITDVNNKIGDTNVEWSSMNILNTISQELRNPNPEEINIGMEGIDELNVSTSSLCDQSVGMDGMNKNTSGGTNGLLVWME